MVWQGLGIDTKSRQTATDTAGKGEGTMRNWKMGVLGGVAALSLMAGGSASASHDHYLVTPGTCVADIASGQTEQGMGEGGYHQYHENVHLGTPGLQAFANESNPVVIYKAGTGPGCE